MANYSNLTFNSDYLSKSLTLDGISFNHVIYTDTHHTQILGRGTWGTTNTSGTLIDDNYAVNAVDINWNGAQPGLGESSTGITTTGELLKLIKDYADKKLDSVPVATSSVYGGFKLGFPQSDNNYPVQLDRNDRAYVNVPQTTYKAGTNIGIGTFEPTINPTEQSINTINSDISTVDVGTNNIGSSYIIGNPSALTIYHATPENATEGQKGNKSDALLAAITTDAQGHVTGYATITPEELWRLLQPYADALYQPKPVEVTHISLDKSNVTVPIGRDVMITATIYPSNAANKNITWTSSNTSIATVTSPTTSGNAAIVTWQGGGEVTITATAEGDTSKTATCRVTCESLQPSTTYYYSVGTEEVTDLNYTSANNAQSVTNVNDIPNSLDISTLVGPVYILLPSGKTPTIVPNSGAGRVALTSLTSPVSGYSYWKSARFAAGATMTIS